MARARLPRSPLPALGRGPLAFDIETVPRIGLEQLPPREGERFRRAAEEEARRAAGPQPPSAAAIAESVDKALALHPLTCRIVAVAFHAVDSNAELAILAGASGEDLAAPAVAASEPELLARFWQAARRARRLIGYSSRRFDVPVILARSALLGVEPTVDLIADDGRHVDLLDVIAAGGPDRRMSLELVGFAFGVPVKQAGHGSEVGRLVAEGRWRELAAYNLEDARATAAIYRRLSGTRRHRARS